MKIFSWKKKDETIRENPQSRVFSDLNKTEQREVLKKGGEDFSKRFTKVIVKLANE